jgi:coproporphyrinogen III oxidase-like Fe-S oxidoreductase
MKNPDLNFFYYLTTACVLNPYDNSLIRPLFKKVPEKQLVESFRGGADDDIDGDDINLYIHLPYCHEICTYCHCSRCLLKTKNDLTRYKDFLLRQIQTFSPSFAGRKIASLYFGGGTPTLFDDASIIGICNALRRSFAFRDHIQVTCECHPATMTPKKFKTLKQCGVNRISLGIQSMDPRVLRMIGRTQTQQQVLRCVDQVRKERFDILNLDLVAGLPGQSEASMADDIRTAVALKPEVIHLTPFSNITLTPHFKKHAADARSFFSARHALITTAKQILHEACYANRGLGPFFRRGQKTGESFVEESYIQRAGSVLGLGAFAHSTLKNRIAFICQPRGNDLTSCDYEGYPINRKYSMANFIALNALIGLNTKIFRTIFHEDIWKAYPAELAFLEDAGVVTSRNTTIKYRGPWSIAQLIKYFSYAKALHDPRLIDALKRSPGHKGYHKETDYSRQKYVSKALWDLWFISLFYKVGL